MQTTHLYDDGKENARVRRASFKCHLLEKHTLYHAKCYKVADMLLQVKRRCTQKPIHTFRYTWIEDEGAAYIWLLAIDGPEDARAKAMHACWICASMIIIWWRWDIDFIPPRAIFRAAPRRRLTLPLIDCGAAYYRLLPFSNDAMTRRLTRLFHRLATDVSFSSPWCAKQSSA